MGVRDHMAYRFLGIPYMLQPVGDLRLAYPIQWYTNETDYVMNATTCKKNQPPSWKKICANSFDNQMAQHARLALATLMAIRMVSTLGVTPRHGE